MFRASDAAFKAGHHARRTGIRSLAKSRDCIILKLEAHALPTGSTAAAQRGGGRKTRGVVQFCGPKKRGKMQIPPLLISTLRTLGALFWGCVYYQRCRGGNICQGRSLAVAPRPFDGRTPQRLRPICYVRLSSILLKNPVVAPALGILERCRLDAPLQTEAVEQRLLHHPPFAHHRENPRFIEKTESEPSR